MVVDGHNVRELAKVFADAQQVHDRPTMVLAKTFKGHDFPRMQLCSRAARLGQTPG